MKEQIVVAGLGRFGRVLVQELTKSGYDVLAVDRRQDTIEELADSDIKAVRGDATSLGLWRDLPIKGVDIGVVAFASNVESNVLTALLFKKIGIKRVVAKSQSELHTELLKAIGVDAIIEPPRESAQKFAHTIGTRLEDYIQVAENFGVAKITATELLQNMTVRDLYDGKRVTVLLLRRGGRVEMVPRDDEIIDEGDLLVVAGKDTDLHQLPGARN